MREQQQQPFLFLFIAVPIWLDPSSLYNICAPTYNPPALTRAFHQKWLKILEKNKFNNPSTRAEELASVSQTTSSSVSSMLQRSTSQSSVPSFIMIVYSKFLFANAYHQQMSQHLPNVWVHPSTETPCLQSVSSPFLADLFPRLHAHHYLKRPRGSPSTPAGVGHLILSKGPCDQILQCCDFLLLPSVSSRATNAITSVKGHRGLGAHR